MNKESIEHKRLRQAVKAKRLWLKEKHVRKRDDTASLKRLVRLKRACRNGQQF